MSVEAPLAGPEHDKDTDDDLSFDEVFLGEF